MPPGNTVIFQRHATLLWTLILCAALTTPVPAFAEAPPPVITIHGHQFEPRELTLPPGKKFKLTIRNRGALPAEFESYDLSREVIIPAGGEVTVYIGPLEAGRYEFFNDFNHAMKGTVVVKPGGDKTPGGK